MRFKKKRGFYASLLYFSGAFFWTFPSPEIIFSIFQVTPFQFPFSVTFLHLAFKCYNIPGLCPRPSSLSSVRDQKCHPKICHPGRRTVLSWRLVRPSRKEKNCLPSSLLSWEKQTTLNHQRFPSTKTAPRGIHNKPYQNNAHPPLVSPCTFTLLQSATSKAQSPKPLSFVFSLFKFITLLRCYTSSNF